MVTVNYRTAGGETRAVDAAPGASVMEAAIKANIPGIEAECGGMLDCATCHVYVSEDDLSRLPPPSEEEGAMLDGVSAERRANSRLSCQIALTDALDGLTVEVPESQT